MSEFLTHGIEEGARVVLAASSLLNPTAGELPAPVSEKTAIVEQSTVAAPEAELAQPSETIAQVALDGSVTLVNVASEEQLSSPILSEALNDTAEATPILGVDSINQNNPDPIHQDVEIDKPATLEPATTIETEVVTTEAAQPLGVDSINQNNPDPIHQDVAVSGQPVTLDAASTEENIVEVISDGGSLFPGDGSVIDSDVKVPTATPTTLTLPPAAAAITRKSETLPVTGPRAELLAKIGAALLGTGAGLLGIKQLNDRDRALRAARVYGGGRPPKTNNESFSPLTSDEDDSPFDLKGKKKK